MKNRIVGSGTVFRGSLLFPLALMLFACAGRQVVSRGDTWAADTLALPDAATELLYLHRHDGVTDSIRVYMAGADSCADTAEGRRFLISEYLERRTGMHLNRATDPGDTISGFFNCALNGRSVQFRSVSRPGRPADLWIPYQGNRSLLPALALRGNQSLHLVSVTHRSSLPDPLSLGKGSVLTYRCSYLDSQGNKQTEHLMLRLNRLDDRAAGMFARYVFRDGDTLLRYGVLNAELDLFSPEAVLWLLPDSYCRPRPADFSGSCQLFWLRRDMLRSLLSGKPAEILLGSYTRREACVLSVPYIRSYRLQAKGMTGAVDVCEFSFRGGRAGFIPCVANPLLLYVSLPAEGVFVELTGVEP